MKCPLIDNECLRDGCAWWDSDVDQCATIALANRLDNINGILDNLDDTLRVTNKTLVTAKQLDYIISKLARTVSKR